MIDQIDTNPYSPQIKAIKRHLKQFYSDFDLWKLTRELNHPQYNITYHDMFPYDYYPDDYDFVKNPVNDEEIEIDNTKFHIDDAHEYLGIRGWSMFTLAGDAVITAMEINDAALRNTFEILGESEDTSVRECRSDDSYGTERFQQIKNAQIQSHKITRYYKRN